jgi:hypothetical protein
VPLSNFVPRGFGICPSFLKSQQLCFQIINKPLELTMRVRLYSEPVS